MPAVSSAAARPAAAAPPRRGLRAALAGCGSSCSSSGGRRGPAPRPSSPPARAAPRQRPLDRYPDPGRRLRDRRRPEAARRAARRASAQRPADPGHHDHPRHLGPAARRPGQRRRTSALDVDLRNAVAKVLGVSWNVQNGTFATIIPGVQNGKYQVGQDNFGATKAREQVVDFATYLTDGQAFLGASSVSASSIRRSPSVRLHHRHQPRLDLPDHPDHATRPSAPRRARSRGPCSTSPTPRRSSSAWPTARSTSTSARR